MTGAIISILILLISFSAYNNHESSFEIFSEEYAVIYIYRKAKSTNAGNKYEIYFNDKEVGVFKGINTAFSANPREAWIVTKRFEEGKFFLKVMDKKEVKDVLVLDVTAGRSYFIEFDASAAFGINSLRLLTFREGQDKLILSNKKDMDVKYGDLTVRIEADKFRSVEDFETASVEADQTSTESDKPQALVSATSDRIYSEVNINIPEISKKCEYCFAMIVGNEDYSSFQTDLNSEVNVDFAESDAKTFREYCLRTLGIPDDNIIYMVNARAIEMQRSLNKLSLIIKNSNGKAKVFFYYAGHGFPDELTQEPYIIPVDVNATDLQFAIKLKDIYAKLAEHPSERITVFLDACFSGGARNQGLLAARGVKVKPKEDPLPGNIVVFSASSGEQSSLPYKEKGHGMFTYYLLKKLQDSEGSVSYGELSNYIRENVGMKSVLVNNKEQNPQTLYGNAAKDNWKNWRFNK
jgi:hypothetical protein